jgi:hypothetical protein
MKASPQTPFFSIQIKSGAFLKKNFETGAFKNNRGLKIVPGRKQRNIQKAI